MPRFTNNAVWITGASAGIGRALALAFADEGADVAVSARRQDRLDAVVAEIEARGRRGLAVPCDVTDETMLRQAADKVVTHFGKMDVAVANAGFGVVGRIEKLSAADWRRQFEVNVIGVTQTARFALAHLRKTNGRLALIGSVASMFPAPKSGPYTASKAAVRAIGQTLSLELHGSGVSCTTIHPGFVTSEIGQVDNHGVFHANRKDPRPQALMWSTERAARTMLRAIHRRKHDYVFTGHGKAAGFLGRHAPGLVRFVLTRGVLPASASER